MIEKNEKLSTTFGSFIDNEAEIGENVKIYPNVNILGKTKIGDGTVIYPNTIVENATIGENCVLKGCEIESTTIGENCVLKACEIENSTIGGNCQIKGGEIEDTTIGDNCTIKNSEIEKSVIGNNNEIKSSFIEESKVKNNVHIGPFAHLRPNSVVLDDCKVGNFVELKNATLGVNSKASHLAYVGDADVGANCNIGCGAIFVNYDGVNKHRSIVEDNCFIGSNCNVVAPVHIKKGSFICAGTTITVDTNEDDFVIGRCRETIKNNRAHLYLGKK